MKWAEVFFDVFMYPLEVASLRRKRRFLMQRVGGKVLEVGAGTGANLRHYNFSRIDHLHITDFKLSERVKNPVPHEGYRLYYHEADVQDLPFDDATFDSVVISLVFCSVPDPARGLAEIARVLKPGGTLIFIEHVRPDAGSLRWIVDALNPVWHKLNGECNLNRDTVGAIRAAGFIIDRIRHSDHGLIAHGVARRE
jgi:ubiquinone/menaquinone biosynthesis C-methylase UbiE